MKAKPFKQLASLEPAHRGRSLRDKAIEVGIVGLLDHTHPTTTKFLNDDLSNEQLGLRHLALMVGSDLRQVNGQALTRAATRSTSRTPAHGDTPRSRVGRAKEKRQCQGGWSLFRGSPHIPMRIRKRRRNSGTEAD
jgi:hypothetical protein